MIELTACLPKYPQTWSTGQGRARTCRNQLAVLQQSSGGLMICSPVAHPRIHSPTLRTPSPQTMERTKTPHCTDLVPETASGGKILPSPPATWKFLHQRPSSSYRNILFQQHIPHNVVMGSALKVAINSSLKSLTTKNECRSQLERAGNRRRFKVYLSHVLQQRGGKRSNCFLTLGISLLVLIV